MSVLLLKARIRYYRLKYNFSAILVTETFPFHVSLLLNIQIHHSAPVYRLGCILTALHSFHLMNQLRQSIFFSRASIVLGSSSMSNTLYISVSPKYKFSYILLHHFITGQDNQNISVIVPISNAVISGSSRANRFSSHASASSVHFATSLLIWDFAAAAA